MEANPRQTIEELSDKLNTPWSTIQEYLKHISKVNRESIGVSHTLSKGNQRIVQSCVISSCNGAQAFLERVMTRGKKWILYDNLESTRPLFPINQTPLATPKPSLHHKKVLLSIWWNTQDIIDFEILKSFQRELTGKASFYNMTMQDHSLQ